VCAYTRLNSEFEVLNAIAKTLVASLELPDLLDNVLQTIVQVLEPADIGAVMLWDQPAGLFKPAAAIGYELNILGEIGLRAGESITGKSFDQGKILLLANSEQVEQAMSDMRPFNREVMRRAIGSDRLPSSAVAAPITAGTQSYGVLVLESLDPCQSFTNENLPFIQTIADLVALAIDRARLETRADAIRAAQQAEKMRTELTASLSHELRIPLATIKGYATAMMVDDLKWTDEKRTEFLELIEDACNDMEGMITDILDSSLIQVDELKLKFQSVDLPVLAGDVATEVQCRTDIHHLVVDFPGGFPTVHADARWIKQVFRNILDNAVKYSPSGGLIMIKGEIRQDDVVVCIADQGVGISAEDLIPLFEKFHRVQGSSTLHVAGTGLGLPIARAIVEAHAGRIWVESQIGEGTSIYFSLSRKSRGEEADEQEHERSVHPDRR
jgi:K+-sensing histidine kinase KdpD